MLKIILAIVLFSVIVIFHELGHFLFAKKNGICVEEFADRNWIQDYFWKADWRDEVFDKVSAIWRMLCNAWRG